MEFGFFDQALRFLAKTSDAELAVHVAEYGDLFETLVNSVTTTRPVTSFAIELLHKTHMLQPRLYREAVNAIVGDGDASLSVYKFTGFDLVAAVRRQQVFMETILSEHWDVQTMPAITDAVKQYGEFLGLVPKLDSGSELTPTPMIDLVWHTHHQHPSRYYDDCLRFAGVFLDHDDHVAPQRILAAAISTIQAMESS